MRRKKTGDADLVTVCGSRMMNVNFLGDMSRNAYDDKNGKFDRTYSWLLTKGKFGENGDISPQQSSQSSEWFTKRVERYEKMANSMKSCQRSRFQQIRSRRSCHENDENSQSDEISPNSRFSRMNSKEDFAESDEFGRRAKMGPLAKWRI